MAFGGLSGAAGFLSKRIEKTRVSDLAPIDELLDDASKGLNDLNKGMKKGMMEKLVDASSSDVRPFIDNIESVSRLYNEPVMLMADEETLYILPADAAKIEDDSNQTDL